MSFFLMMVVASIYSGAAISYLLEGKPLWALTALSWAVGNAALAWMSR